MQQSNKPLIIGITGTIGSGKTTVCKVIEQQYPVYYADEIAHNVLDQPDIIKSLSDKWGSVLLNNEAIDRKRLAERVFSDKDDLNFLNALIHPKVLAEMQHLTDICQSPVIFFEVPLLFEANLQNCFDYIILIKADMNIRINRIAQRDKLSRAEISLRIAMQFDDKKKEKQADIAIINNGRQDELQSNVSDILNKIKGLKHKDVQPFNKNNVL